MKRLSIIALSCALSAVVTAQVRWGEWNQWGQQTDSTYCNPVLPSDYSDLDCIRVGNDYYAISSTMQ